MGTAPDLEYRKSVVAQAGEVQQQRPRPLARQAAAERSIAKGAPARTSSLPKGISGIGGMISRGGGVLSLVNLPGAIKSYR